MVFILFLLFLFHNLLSQIVVVDAQLLKQLQQQPPPPKYGYIKPVENTDDIAKKINSWSNADVNHIWELSGLYEGDILLYHQDSSKNGLLNSTAYWPNATVPYHIDEEFSNNDTITILRAMQEYHNKTCIKFRPYQKRDTNWIQIMGDDSGCWSSVGMQGGGQVVNLQKPGCVHHGVVVHELLHALGFYHQQSASDRDKYVKIHWENIEEGHEHNFNKYNSSIVTDFGTHYDYSSVMHYSSKAFSRNNKTTIEPLQQKDVVLGQRKGLSEIDVTKLNRMYKSICKLHSSSTTNNNHNSDHKEFLTFLNWIEKEFQI